MKAVVLLSGGLDSTINTYLAKANCESIMTLSFDYGQRAAKKEIQSASLISSKLNIQHKVISLEFFKDIGKSSLFSNSNRQVPVGQSVEIDDLKISQESAKSVWVPNRNGIFLNIAAGFAESLDFDFVIPGFNIEEAATFPDNSENYLNSLNKSFEYSTSNGVKVYCYTTNKNKTEIVKIGIDLGVDWSLMWPCYFDKNNWCGECESCKRTLRAMKQNNIKINELFRV